MKLDADYNSNIDYEAWEASRKELVKYNQEVWDTRAGLSLLGELHAVEMNRFEVNGSLLKSLPVQADFRNIAVTLFADGKEVYSKVFTTIIACRVPSATGYSWEVRFTGNINVRSFALSTSMQELASPN